SQHAVLLIQEELLMPVQPANNPRSSTPRGSLASELRSDQTGFLTTLQWTSLDATGQIARNGAGQGRGVLSCGGPTRSASRRTPGRLLLQADYCPSSDLKSSPFHHSSVRPAARIHRLSRDAGGGAHGLPGLRVFA